METFFSLLVLLVIEEQGSLLEFELLCLVLVNVEGVNVAVLLDEVEALALRPGHVCQPLREDALLNQLLRLDFVQLALAAGIPRRPHSHFVSRHVGHQVVRLLGVVLPEEALLSLVLLVVHAQGDRVLVDGHGVVDGAVVRLRVLLGGDGGSTGGGLAGIAKVFRFLPFLQEGPRAFANLRDS